MDVVDAAADGVLFDDSNTHGDVVGFEVGVEKSLLVDDALLRVADAKRRIPELLKRLLLCMRMVDEDLF